MTVDEQTGLAANTTRDETNEDRDRDVIVLKKSTVITGLVALVFFVVGLGAGYALATRSLGGSALAAAQVPTQQVQPAAQPQQPARLDNVSVDDDPAIGPDDAPVTIVEFSDFQCPYCLRFQQDTFDALMEQYGDKIRFVYRDFPLSSIHPQAEKAAEAGQCAYEQGKFWEMHDAIYANQQIDISISALKGLAQQIQLDEDQFDQCLDSGKYAQEIAKDTQDGNAYGVTGTPTFFINGVTLVGAQPLSAFQTIIDQELAAQ